ncbi:RHS repeat-associated core domain-containing protein [Xenorhabdus bovienii]|nr:RHS repeat-associated core domain-containing protein [Xenorhabdus bovienii]MDE9566524.1 RHS repeat-associated core domain-containing protein [Xenorhabdus bovienii]
MFVFVNARCLHLTHSQQDGSTGRLLRLRAVIENAVFDPGLKFAGQWLDEESGLFYNRFRYYSPLAGCYLTPDPIGIQGGENTYGYVPNPTGFIDPLGLAKKNPEPTGREKAAPKVKEPTYEIVRYMSAEELNEVIKAGGKKIVPHFNSDRTARWVNLPTEKGVTNPNKIDNIYKVTYTVKESGYNLLDFNKAVVMEKSGLGEADLPDGVFKKRNEIGVRGIGVNVLKEVNNNIVKAEYQKQLPNDKNKYGESKPLPNKPLPICKNKKKGR